MSTSIFGCPFDEGYEGNEGHGESLYQVATLLLQSAWKYPSSPCITSKPAPPTLPAFHGVPGHFLFFPFFDLFKINKFKQCLFEHAKQLQTRISKADSGLRTYNYMHVSPCSRACIFVYKRRFGVQDVNGVLTLMHCSSFASCLSFGLYSTILLSLGMQGSSIIHHLSTIFSIHHTSVQNSVPLKEPQEMTRNISTIAKKHEEM